MKDDISISFLVFWISNRAQAHCLPFLIELKVKTRAWRLHPNTRNQAMGMLEVTCVPAIMEETLIREYTVNLPTLHNCGFYPTGALP